MRSLRHVPVRSMTIALSVAILLGGRSGAIAQPPRVSDLVKIQPAEWTKLEATFKDKRTVFNDLVSGKAETGPEAIPVIDLAAQYLVFRVTWPDNQRASPPGRMDSVVTDFEKEVQVATKNKPNTQAFLKAFSERAIKYAKEVIDRNSLPIARINATRMLGSLAEADIEEVADVLADVVKDPQQLDAVKFYGLRGIGKLFAQAHQPNTTLFQTPAGKEREGRCVQALIGFIERKPANPDLYSKEDGTLDALAYVRREAVRALALYGRPAVLEKGEVKATPAATLVKVARKEGLFPDPRPDEQVEAVVGLARMQAKAVPAYQVDFASFQLGGALVDLADESQKTKLGAQAWKVDGARMLEALQSLRKENAASKYTTALVDQALPILKSLETDGAATNGAQLGVWLGNNRPQATSLFKGLPETPKAAEDAKTPPTEPKGKPDQATPPK